MTAEPTELVVNVDAAGQYMILGERMARPATKIIGGLEILLGLWAFSGFARVECAAAQTLALIAMNSLEIVLAGDLLISAIGMVGLNFAFLAVIWHWALFAPKP